MGILIKDFIFCDDIRMEEGKKISIMGIYADKLRIRLKNTDLKRFRLFISAFIKLENTKSEYFNKNINFEVSVKFQDKNLAKLEGIINFGIDKFANFPIQKIEFIVEQPGTLTFHALFKNDKNQILLEHLESLNVIIEHHENELPA